MPDFVYGLHDFTPENDDEIAFRAGDRIEILEKDDLYGDGWWQGRNLAGKIGLFPQSYTTPTPEAFLSQDNSTTNGQPPVQGTTAPAPALSPLAEEPSPLPSLNSGSNGKAIPDSSSRNGHSPVPGAPSPDGAFRSTITDVQEALEQLGRSSREGSFSFRDGDTTDRETETDLETDREPLHSPDDDEDHGENWHKGTRSKLAMKARAEQQADGPSGLTPLGQPFIQEPTPAIPAEMISDESEGEEEDHYHHQSNGNGLHRHPSHIPEEDETEDNLPTASNVNGFNIPSIPAPAAADSRSPDSLQPLPLSDNGTDLDFQPSTDFIVPSPSSNPASIPGSQVPTARRTSFPVEVKSSSSANLSSPPRSHANIPAEITVTSSPGQKSQKSQKSALPTPTSPNTIAPPEILNAIIGLGHTTTPVDDGSDAGRSPLMSSLPSPPASQSGQIGLSALRASTGTGISSNLTNGTGGRRHPSEWGVEEVLEWAKSKGFDTAICNKFAEHEITGDVLLDLDVNNLKSELEIMAFGKRVRIANAIAELRRPASVGSSEHIHRINSSEQMSSHPGSGAMSAGLTTRSSSAHQSLNSPVTAGSGAPMWHTPSSQFANGMANGMNGYGHGHVRSPSSILSPESPPHTGDIVLPSPGFGELDRVANNSRATTASAATTNTTGTMGTITSSANTVTSAPPTVGLGFSAVSLGQSSSGVDGNDIFAGLRTGPGQLTLSPSDSALGATAKKSLEKEVEGEKEGAERDVMSEGETGSVQGTTKRRRMFGRSGSVASDKETSSARPSKEYTVVSNSVPATPSSITKRGSADDSVNSLSTSTRRKRSVDHTKDREKDRFSIFGGIGSIGHIGSLGKGRKPPPRLSGSYDDNERPSRLSPSNLLHMGSQRRNRPSTSQGISAPSSPRKGTFGQIGGKEEREATLLRKRTSSQAEAPTKAAISSPLSPTSPNGTVATPGGLRPGVSVIEQIGEPDHKGWMRKKGEHYNTWKMRYFILKGPHLYYMRSDSKTETKIKGYIDIIGYKVIVDENINPGKYGFRLIHDTKKTHYFSSDEQLTVREWMKALMKATIGRDYTKPVISSCNIPTIPLTVAQTMNPAPRPPSPSQRDATQKALRRDNPNQLSSRDARVLMGLPSPGGGAPPGGVDTKEADRARLESFFTVNSVGSDPDKATFMSETTAVNTPSQAGFGTNAVPPRPSRDARGVGLNYEAGVDESLIRWANDYLPPGLQMRDLTGPMFSGLALFRLAEGIKGKPAEPPVPDSAFPSSSTDEKLDGLFRLFDFFLDNDVKMGSVSINDVRQGRRDKIMQLLRALKQWEDKRRALARSIGKGGVHAGPFMAVEAA